MPGYAWWNHLAHIAAKSRDFLDQARTQVAVLQGRHEENRVHFRGQLAIGVGHLQFRFKIRDGAEASHNERGAESSAEIHREAIEGFHVYSRGDVCRANLGDRLVDDLDALFSGEDRRGLVSVDQNRKDDLVENGGGTRSDIEMAVRDRVE